LPSPAKQKFKTVLIRKFIVKNSLYLQKQQSKLARELICVRAAGLSHIRQKIMYKKIYQSKKILLGDFKNADENNDTSTGEFVALDA